jgi:hypothetical protein
MRALSDHEKRTIRYAVVGISIYLVLFGGLRGWKYLEKKRADYQHLVKEASGLRQEVQPYETKVLLVKKLMENTHIDPAKLSRATVVGSASSAIQKAAATGGLGLGPIRESSARASTKELASMQLEGAGPVQAVTTFLHRLDTLGFPLIVDSVQLSPQPTRPGMPAMLKLNLTIIILDFDQWKKEEVANARTL